MRWMAIIVVSLAASLATLAPARSEPAMTAGDLQQLCTGEDHVSRNACRIYILGVTQGIGVGVRMTRGNAATGTPCVPADISAETLEQTVKARLAEDLAKRPADRDLEASGFIGAVLLSAFPCKKHP